MNIEMVARVLVAIGFVLLAFIVKQFLPAYLSQKGQNLATKEDIGAITSTVESIKTDLQSRLEAFKVSLEAERHRFATQFSRLDHQRSTGVMQLHATMCDIEQLLIWNAGAAATGKVTTTPEARTMAALNAAWEGVAKLNHLLNYHSLLLGDDLCKKVQAWSREVMGLVAAVGHEVEPLRVAADTTTASLDEREAAINAIRSRHIDPWVLRMGEIRRGLENQFRTILGQTG